MQTSVVTGAPAWHTLAVDTVLSSLTTDPGKGLTAQEASKRLAQYGENRLQEQKRISPWWLFLEQFKDVLVIILLIATALSGLLGHEIEAIAIAVIVLFAVILGFVQEYRAERAIEALRKMTAPTATVIRDSEEVEVQAVQLVPGDIVRLTAGDKVPADARVIESMSLHADEASLTGESLPVGKIPEPFAGEHLAVGDRRNMVHAGTTVTYGRGTAVVTATGMQTEFGKIAGMLQSVGTEDTPLQKQLDRVGAALAKAAFVVVAIISVLGYLRGQPLLEVFIFGIALAVAVVPEALPAVVTISLAIGVQRMARRHALVRRLPAVETLGSTTVICSDKTGTLTKDEMTVRRIVCGDSLFDVSGEGYEPTGKFLHNKKETHPSEALRELLTAAALASDAHLFQHPSTRSGSFDEGQWDIKGDPTEGALVVAAAKAGLHKGALDEQHPRVAEIPFTSETKRMTTLHKVRGDGTVAYVKGAPEVVIAACAMQRIQDGDQPIDEATREEILHQAHAMAENALRVLAIASKEVNDVHDAGSGLTLLGLVGMIDPPRPEALLAVERCRHAGIKVVMITGDHPVTAMTIARELGILRDGRAVIGSELEDMSDAELEGEIESIDVCARVSPAHKLRIVAALQKQGHVVAMTGDGVNDAPALKKADIGIAMGITGTDVTKEAAAMMLTDDNFASIVAAVEEGRGIYGNIKKYLMYLLSSNIGEICLMTAATLAGLPLPLTAIQILYVNLATDGLPALALAVDPPERDLMKRPPRDPQRGIFTRPAVALMLAGGLWSMAVNIILFQRALAAGRPLTEAMTMTFIALVLIQFFKAYCFRSDRWSIVRHPFLNHWLNLAILWELALLVLIIYVPFLQQPFQTFSMSLWDWVIVTLGAATVIPVLEMVKMFVRRGVFGRLS
ncbi:MAG: Cation-transporting ATPase pacL [Candidatus Peregrinibacteria bacterium Greene0416_19]|nr:MAG: Cation-transporting ATPase pacL [Candidatus Peregrinibacteria bacterium Greene0416_19]